MTRDQSHPSGAPVRHSLAVSARRRARHVVMCVLSILAFAGLADEAHAAFELGDIRPYMQTAIKRKLGPSVAAQFTTDNCTSAGKRGWTCLWAHPDRGVSAEFTGSATVKAIKVRGRCRIKVSGHFNELDSGRSGTFSYVTTGRSRFCR